MDDSRIGTYGAAALIFSILFRVAALASLGAGHPSAPLSCSSPPKRCRGRRWCGSGTTCRPRASAASPTIPDRPTRTRCWSRSPSAAVIVARHGLAERRLCRGGHRHSLLDRGDLYVHPDQRAGDRRTNRRYSRRLPANRRDFVSSWRGSRCLIEPMATIELALRQTLHHRRAVGLCVGCGRTLDEIGALDRLLGRRNAARSWNACRRGSRRFGAAPERVTA